MQINPTRPLLTLASDRLLVPVGGSLADASGNTLRRMHREHQFHLRGILNDVQRRERLEKLITRLQLPDDLDFALWRTDRATGRRLEGAFPAIVRLAEWANRQQLPPEVRARLQHAQAVLQFDSGNYPAAEHHVREALGMLHTADTALFGALQQQLAAVLLVDYRTEEALQLLDDSLACLSNLRQTRHPSYASSLKSKAYALLLRGAEGDIDMALALLDQELSIRGASLGKSHPTYADSLKANARTLLLRAKKGDINAALALLDEALSIAQASLGKSNFNYASSLHNKAQALLQRGLNDDVRDAIAIMDSVLQSYESVLGRNHREYAVGLSSKASAHLQRKQGADIRRAVDLLNEVVEIVRTTRGDQHIDTAQAMFRRGRALAIQGRKDRPKEGLVDIDEAIRIIDELFPNGHPILVGFLTTRASLRRKLGQPKGAEADAKRAAEVRAKFGRHLENS